MPAPKAADTVAELIAAIQGNYADYWNRAAMIEGKASLALPALLELQDLRDNMEEHIKGALERNKIIKHYIPPDRMTQLCQQITAKLLHPKVKG